MEKVNTKGQDSPRAQKSDNSAGQNGMPLFWLLLRNEKDKAWLKMSSLVMEIKILI